MSGDKAIITTDDDHNVVARAREHVRDRLAALDRRDFIHDAELVVSELVTNAVLHGGGCRTVSVDVADMGARIEVTDWRPVPPVLGLPVTEGMTGRGLRLVASIASRWGASASGEGKVVWAELAEGSGDQTSTAESEVFAPWRDGGPEATTHYHVVLGDVPTDLLISAKGHVDNLVREFMLAAAGERSGTTGAVPPHMRGLVDTIAHRFSEARESIKRQALQSARRGDTHTRLELDLTADAADAGEAYLAALDAVDAYCRAARLLTLETPPQHRVFRRWYIEELILQLRCLTRGETPQPPVPFESRLLREIERVAVAQRITEQSARLYNVAGALAGAATPEAVADAVLDQGVAALGAAGGGVLLATDEPRLAVPGTVGYDADLVARLKDESEFAELPAAFALRTGEPVWIESRAERNSRFPELSDLEPATVSLCAVPLQIQGRRLGALRFSFNEPRLFDEDERRFVLTLAAQAAQALDRSQLQESQIEASSRLQKSLLPPSLPTIEGVETTAVYEPFGSGMEVGGDFYDLWELSPGIYGIAIGDVVGTGPEAAALTALVRYSLRALTIRERAVIPTLVALNDMLQSTAPSPTPGEVFCTAIFGTLRPTADGLEVELASGGHPFPLVRRASGVIEELPLGGSLLGVLDDIDVATVRLTLGSGDLLLLVTDGVLEARDADGALFDDDGLHRTLTGAGPGAAAAAEAVHNAVLAHVGGALADDMAILAVAVN